jgi:hypothetical protein
LDGDPNFSIIATLPANTTTYTQTGLLGGQIWFGFVRATNNGNLSAPSNIATAEVLAALFTTVWNTTISGVSVAGAILLPIVDNATDFNLDIYVGGVFLRKIVNTAGKTITSAELGTPGLKTIALGGEMNSWRFGNGGDKAKIVDITQWGQYDTILGDGFDGCSNLNITATDTPLLLLARANTTTILNGIFFRCTILNSPNLLLWNFNGVQYMGGGFFAVSGFNQPIGDSWDVSTVTNMNQMFDTSLAFNQSIGGFDILSRVGRTTISMTRILFAGTMNTANYDATLIGWDAQIASTIANCGTVGVNGRTYTSAGAGGTARTNLIATGLMAFSGDSGV